MRPDCWTSSRKDGQGQRTNVEGLMQPVSRRKHVSQANRGRALEELIMAANAQYLSKGIAVVQKVPTPWQVIRQGPRIVSAFPERKSTVDFVGITCGRAIAFDAKSTLTKTRFPLDNIEPHQFEFLRSWDRHGGIAFVLMEFAAREEFYVAAFGQLREWWEERERGGRKSVPYDVVREECRRVTAGRGVVLDYLQGVSGL